MTREEKATKYDEALEWMRKVYPTLTGADKEDAEHYFPELKESEDERIRKVLVDMVKRETGFTGFPSQGQVLAYLEKQKENSKSADSIPSNCASDAKCENRWHKVGDSLPDSAREVICKDAIGNFFIGRYYKESGSWEVSMYDDVDKSNEDNPPVIMWCDIPSEKQKEQKPIAESKRLAHEVIEYLIRCGYSPVLKDDSKKEHFHIDIPRHKDDFWLSEEYKHCRSVLGEYYMEGDYGGDTYTLYIWRAKKEQKPAEVDEYKIIKKHITEDSLSSEVNKRLTECGWYVSDEKPEEWSEEDKFKLEDAITGIDVGIGFYETEGKHPNLLKAIIESKDWLSSLPERFNLQPKNEWSKEDEKKRSLLIDILKVNHPNVYFKVNPANTLNMEAMHVEELVDWLKSLRPQPKKELSIEKAIKWLDDTFYFLDNSSGRGRDCEITTHDFDSLEEMYDSFRKAVIVDSEPHWKPSEEQMTALKCAIEDIAKFSKRGGRQVEFENEPYYMALHSLYEQLKKLM